MKITPSFRRALLTKSNQTTFVKGEAVLADQTIESCKESYTCNYGQQKIIAAARNNWAQDIDVSWLASASVSYEISPNINDYLIIDCCAVSSDLPNRNMQGFLMEELSYFDIAHGKQVYQTFVGKPSCDSHRNEVDQDPDLAKGVIFAAAMQYVPAYDLYKIRLLQGWDRTKDTKLVNDIYTGKRRYYSMGALVQVFVDSVTGLPSGSPGASKHPQGSVVNNQLVWSICCGVGFIENSVVCEPADVSASGEIF